MFPLGCRAGSVYGYQLTSQRNIKINFQPKLGLRGADPPSTKYEQKSFSTLLGKLVANFDYQVDLVAKNCDQLL